MYELFFCKILNNKFETGFYSLLIDLKTNENRIGNTK